MLSTKPADASSLRLTASASGVPHAVRSVEHSPGSPSSLMPGAVKSMAREQRTFTNAHQSMLLATFANHSASRCLYTLKHLS